MFVDSKTLVISDRNTAALMYSQIKIKSKLSGVNAECPGPKIYSKYAF